MGVAEYELARALPEPLDTKLPSIEQLKSELGAVLADGSNREDRSRTRRPQRHDNYRHEQAVDQSIVLTLRRPHTTLGLAMLLRSRWLTLSLSS